MAEAAAFTICQNEPRWLPVWVKYYAKYFDPSDMYIIDHDSSGDGKSVLQDLRTEYQGLNVVPVHNLTSFEHAWLRDSVQHFQKFLLQSYKVTVFAEIDEILYVPHGSRFRNGLATFVSMMNRNYSISNGYEIVQTDDEATIDWDKPLLPQRSKWYASKRYCKPLISKIPLRWGLGFHTAENALVVPETTPPELYLLHLHKLDWEYLLVKHSESARRRWSHTDKKKWAGWQNSVSDPKKLRMWYETNIDTRNGPAGKASSWTKAEWVNIPEELLAADIV